jgi:flagellin
MGLRINTNVPALIAQRNLRSTRADLDKTLERLSSGLRINTAGDDAAGLAISENLRAEMRGLAQAERNAQDGISLVQIAEGSLSEIGNIMIRMRELAVQAASDTVGPQERKFLDNEFQHLLEEVDRISHSTVFNGVPLLNGTGSTFEVQIGTKNNPLVDRIKLFDASSTDVNVVSLGINLTNIAEKITAQNALDAMDKAMDIVVAIRAEFGAMQNRLQSIINNLMVNRENVASANSRIRDADMAIEATNLTKNQILMQSGVSVLGQANGVIKSALTLLQNNG